MKTQSNQLVHETAHDTVAINLATTPRLSGTGQTRILSVVGLENKIIAIGGDLTALTAVGDLNIMIEGLYGVEYCIICSMKYIPVTVSEGSNLYVAVNTDGVSLYSTNVYASQLVPAYTSTLVGLPLNVLAGSAFDTLGYNLIRLWICDGFVRICYIGDNN